MKKLLFLLLIAPLFSVGQITKQKKSTAVEVGTAKNFGVEIAQMNKIPGDPDYYFITYGNLKYQVLDKSESFGFKDVDGAFDFLYTSIVDGFKNKEDQTLNIDGGTLSIQYSMGSFRFYFVSSAGVDSWSGYITKKQFSTLFGKKYNKADFKK